MDLHRCRGEACLQVLHAFPAELSATAGQVASDAGLLLWARIESAGLPRGRAGLFRAASSSAGLPERPSLPWLCARLDPADSLLSIKGCEMPLMSPAMPPDGRWSTGLLLYMTSLLLPGLQSCSRDMSCRCYVAELQMAALYGCVLYERLTVADSCTGNTCQFTRCACCW